MMERNFESALAAISSGYGEGVCEGVRYGVTVRKSRDGKRTTDGVIRNILKRSIDELCIVFVACVVDDMRPEQFTKLFALILETADAVERRFMGSCRCRGPTPRRGGPMYNRSSS